MRCPHCEVRLSRGAKGLCPSCGGDLAGEIRSGGSALALSVAIVVTFLFAAVIGLAVIQDGLFDIPGATAEQVHITPNDLKTEACVSRLRELGQMLESIYADKGRYPTIGEFMELEMPVMAVCPESDESYEYVPGAVRTESAGRISFAAPPSFPATGGPIDTYALICRTHNGVGKDQVFATQNGVERR